MFYLVIKLIVYQKIIILHNLNLRNQEANMVEPAYVLYVQALLLTWQCDVMGVYQSVTDITFTELSLGHGKFKVSEDSKAGYLYHPSVTEIYVIFPVGVDITTQSLTHCVSVSIQNPLCAMYINKEGSTPELCMG